MELEIKPKSTKGGPREGSGRKKGSTNRYSSRDLLQALTTVANGQEYVDQLAEDYWTARLSGDKMLGHKYHQLISSKVFADLHTVEVDETTTVENRSQAFLRALEVIGGVAQSADNGDQES